jgi:glycolate oxidase iron-sulfur subunit
MRTEFSLAQLADPAIQASEQILRACVHCGFCTATCPTYVLLGDERDSPRGRIYLIKELLESGGAATDIEARHLDRCLSCLSCMTTCPSGVNYMHLVDHARRVVANTYKRSLFDRAERWFLDAVLPYSGRFRLALIGALLARPFRRLLPQGLRTMIDLAPRRMPAPSRSDRPQVFPAEGSRRMRVALMPGCVQKVLNPEINEATIRLLTRHGCEVVVAKRSGCCGALSHHLGKDAEALIKANIAAWIAEKDMRGLDAIVINASGCGTMVKDYGFLLRNDPKMGEAAKTVSALARDVSEIMAEIGIRRSPRGPRLSVAYHAACSLQHGQRVLDPPKELLRSAGFEVREIPESHLCCGSAGTYNLLQPELSAKLRERKLANIDATGAEVVAAGNIGCMVQLAAEAGRPVLHTVELLDWASGGPRPTRLALNAVISEQVDPDDR